MCGGHPKRAARASRSASRASSDDDEPAPKAARVGSDTAVLGGVAEEEEEAQSAAMAGAVGADPAPMVNAAAAAAAADLRAAFGEAPASAPRTDSGAGAVPGAANARAVPLVAIDGVNPGPAAEGSVVNPASTVTQADLDKAVQQVLAKVDAKLKKYLQKGDPALRSLINSAVQPVINAHLDNIQERLHGVEAKSGTLAAAATAAASARSIALRHAGGNHGPGAGSSSTSCWGSIGAGVSFEDAGPP